MKYWNELEKDVFSYFNWFRNVKSEEAISKLNVFNINGSMIFCPDDKNDFLKKADNTIRTLFEDELDKQYEFYLFANVEINKLNFRVSNYRKVWKTLQSNWQLEHFEKGPEIETSIDGKRFFSSIASFESDNLLTALKILIYDPNKYIIFASKRDHVLTKEYIGTLVDITFSGENKFRDGIDYCNLSLSLCPQKDIIFRWGDSSEEVGLSLIFNGEIYEFFDDFFRKNGANII